MRCLVNSEDCIDDTYSAISNNIMYERQKRAEGKEIQNDDVAILSKEIQNSISFLSDYSHNQSSCCIDESCEGGLDAYANNDTDEWSVFWDNYHDRCYFYNSKTNISTWHPPPGLVKDSSIHEHASMNSKDLHGESFVDPSFHVQRNQESKEDYKEAWTIREPMGGSLDSYFMQGRKKKKAKRFKKKLWDAVNVEGISAVTFKYWRQRYLLFSKFDEGIQMDEEGWFSVTPESIAEHHASRCSGGTIIDCFLGVGGNAIQFAKRCDHVIAIDIDKKKVEYARHNARIYGVDESIDFLYGDFFSLAPRLKGDAVFLSPPWGGPQYSQVDAYDLRTMLKPLNGYALFKVAMKIAPKVVMFLPRNVELNQLAEIARQVKPPWLLEVEWNYVYGKVKAVTAYFTRPSQ